ncbi:hypothetical protein A2W14_00515 [Candidatus Gottesmanbacteria bacterium RBG_16_37_8]|uniref:UvrC family homology region profile domain-containing protein n=1 Tax=Candidatus Gottesmanbacteria bacterium RBG_16_37_8 TaxID=1798371 RepID=A0A1F5YQN1_9BACT|nr:MAG: hypothetical protein A2W14_00515 [Candidatus Gottesmanbacteria bacterium RBG_16_37_8]
MSNIKNIRKVLTGKSDIVIKNLKRSMKKAAENKVYETAARIRDRINELIKFHDRKGFFIDQYLENPQIAVNTWKIEQKKLVKELKKHLYIPSEINTVECYDISNLGGKQATGSMITFINGKADKSRYRHFRIKTIASPNDFDMLKEIFVRRLKHREWPLPDLFVVDGGKQQLAVLLSVLHFYKMEIPAVSLAKRFEEIFVQSNGAYIKIKLSSDSPALNLMKRMRDEAHRFALIYHRKLRLKNLLNLLHN